MLLKFGGRPLGLTPWRGAGAIVFLSCALCSCTALERTETNASARLRETARLAEEVKEFGKTLGIAPTAALYQTVDHASPLSMLWVWMQRAGTVALHAPVDIRMAIGFATIKEQIKLEQIYRVDGYSVYYRQGNEFADARAVATVGFAEEGIVRQVKVILHEDLHGDQNFALPWDIEESIVTPLGSLAAVEFFKRKGDTDNLHRAVTSVEEERKFSRELNELVNEAERLLKSDPVDQAKEEVLALIPSYPTYARQFRRQVAGQNPATVLEAKLSHDLAYYRYFDAIAGLSEMAPALKVLIEDFKTFPSDLSLDGLESYLRLLSSKYAAAKKQKGDVLE
jgi:hypothetical protein